MPSLSDEKKETLYAWFDAVEMDDKEFDVETWAEDLDLAESTIYKHRKLWQEERQQESEVQEMITRPDPEQRLRDMMESTPGGGGKKARYVLEMVEANPRILEDPPRLHQLLTEGANFKEFYAKNIVDAVMSAQAEHGGPPSYYGPPPSGGQQPPMGWGYNQGPGQGYGHPQGPYGPPQGPSGWQPPGGQDESLSKEDVAEIVAETLEAKAEEKARDEKMAQMFATLEQRIEEIAGGDQGGTEYVEVAEPKLDEDGNVMRDESGAPIRTIVRKPAHMVQQDDESLLDELIKLKQAGIPVFGGGSDEIDRVERKIERLEDKLDDSGGDSKIQTELAELKAELAAQEAKRETAQQYHEDQTELRQRLLEKELALERQAGDMPADAQIVDKGMDKTEQTIARVLDNQDRRMDRLERVAMIILTEGDTEGLPTGEVAPEDLEEIRQAQEAIDRQEGRLPAGAGDAGGSVEGEAGDDEEAGEGRWPGSAGAAESEDPLNRVVDEGFTPPGEEE